MIVRAYHFDELTFSMIVLTLFPLHLHSVYIKKKPVYHPPSYESGYGGGDDYAKAAASHQYEHKQLPEQPQHAQPQKQDQKH